MINRIYYRYPLKIIIALVIFSPGLILNDNLLNSGLLNTDAHSVNGFSVSAAEKKSNKKTRKTPAMREKVYSQLASAQKLADDGKIQEGLAVLERLKSRAKQLNSYEKAMMWNFLGFIHYGNEKSDGSNIGQAIAAFSQVVAQKNIPESLELSTLFSLAQLSMQTEKYQQALNYLSRWEKLKDGELSGNALVLKANANYAMKKYQSALQAITLAIDNSEKKNKQPKENWLVLKRALHYELKQPKQVTGVSEKLVRYYSKPQYWVELANMYGEIGETRKQLAVMEASYQQGYVTKKADIQSLAQLYYFSGAPYKAAELLSEQLEKGVIENDVTILQFLAQSWTAAKEDAKAVPVLKKAAELSEDGNMDARLAEVLLGLERWQDVISVAKAAKKKGGLDNPGNIDVAMGMAYFNLKKLPQAISAFEQAKRERKVQKMAAQWLRYVEVEKRKQDQLKESIVALGGS
ncbi:tetratricopeptide repeat protein [Aliikangiella coralliicola]|uniref:Tetratricopeptide repeat protein n=1 Tax=Aliikangiella coralliicola TaxID=2592383 RepID=A0A545UG13_9GAMM|nr:CDC27 family protein [Aliikangiella coralliicola]TQV88375.1 hypothetical protein FLL46_07565 [Aliikangiella coralliicola]